MVRLYSLQIIRKENDKVTQLCAVFDINSLCTFFERSSYHEFITLFSKTIVQRTHASCRQSIKQGDYMCHVFVRMDNLAGVVISDHEYPSRVAHTLLTKMLNDFTSTIPTEMWSDHSITSVDYPPLRTHLSKYQDPKECDALMKIQSELNETHIILVISC